MEAQTRYAKSGDVHIAYRVFGDGPRDILLIPGTLSHAELFWEFPPNEYLLKRFTSFGRVIVFDKRGQGLSDRLAEQTLEERIGDVRAVLDAAGFRRHGHFGWSEGGSMSIDVRGHLSRSNLSPWSCAAASLRLRAEPWAAARATPSNNSFPCMIENTGARAFSVLSQRAEPRKDEAFLRWFGRLERATASPGTILALLRANYDIDVRTFCLQFPGTHSGSPSR